MLRLLSTAARHAGARVRRFCPGGTDGARPAHRRIGAPLMPVVRALYPQLVPRDGVRALFALDTTAQNLIWVIGPVAATFLASAVSTALPLVVSACVTVGGTVCFLVNAREFGPNCSAIQPHSARF
ncbi:hypothetical protein AB4Z39_08560 [Mycobacterium adipatum]